MGIDKLKYHIIILLCIIINTSNASQYYIREMAYVTIGGVYGSSSVDFLDDYKNIIGGNNVSFKHSPAYGVGLKFWLNNNYRLSVGADYFTSNLYDSFNQFDSLSIGTVDRNLSENITSSTLPIIFSIDYIPLEQQFKTYVSLGTGIVISKVKWTEDVNSSRISDPRVGGTHYDDTDLVPLIRIATGVELDFDKAVAGLVIGNLTFELRYTYMFRNLDLYGKIKNQLGEKSSQLPEKVLFLPGYLSLNLQFGIEFFQTIGK